MKNLKAKIFCIGLFTVLWAGCNDLINDAQPKTFVSESEYYQSPEDVRKGVNGAYNELQSLYYTGNATDIWAATEMRADNTTYQFNPDDRGEFEMESMDEFLVRTDNPDVEALWSTLYNGILQCNTVIGRMESVEFEDSEQKNQYMGEAKFLRAFNYFHLVRLFGGVPLILDETRSPEEAFSEGRMEPEGVYEQIITDVSEAIEMLPESYPASEAGRATKGAGRILLADVYMTRGEYESAIGQLETITTMGYGLLPDYSNIYDPANKNNEESIFEIQFQSGISGGTEASEWTYRFVPYNSGSDIIGFNDLSFSHAGYNIPTFDIIDAYENGDERKSASIAYYVKEGNRSFDVAIGDSIPYINKYAHSFEQPGQTNENWPVYRYAGALLMLAEALNETGQTGDAYQYLNTVRNRAGLTSLSGLSQSEFREAVYHEQRVELAFENHRWYNLRRTGRAIEVMAAHGQEMLQRVPRLTNNAYDIQEYKLIFPIPFREVRLNGLEQNAGW